MEVYLVTDLAANVSHTQKMVITVVTCPLAGCDSVFVLGGPPLNEISKFDFQLIKVYWWSPTLSKTPTPIAPSSLTPVYCWSIAGLLLVNLKRTAVEIWPPPSLWARPQSLSVRSS